MSDAEFMWGGMRESEGGNPNHVSGSIGLTWRACMRERGGREQALCVGVRGAGGSCSWIVTQRVWTVETGVSGTGLCTLETDTVRSEYGDRERES